MNKFINHSAMISSSKGKYPFIIANIDTSEKGEKECSEKGEKECSEKGHIGRVYLILNQKLMSFSLILLELMI